MSELLNRFPQYSLNLFGVDNSSIMVNQARKLLGGKALIYLGDNSKLPCKDDSFDLVTAKNVTSICIPEIRRVLHEKGYFIFREYGPGKGLIEVSALFPKERLIEVVKSFPFIESFSGEDEREILNRFNRPLEEITSDPLIIVTRRKRW